MNQGSGSFIFNYVQNNYRGKQLSPPLSSNNQNLLKIVQGSGVEDGGGPLPPNLGKLAIPEDLRENFCQSRIH